jgi:hypothetical protein
LTGLGTFGWTIGATATGGACGAIGLLPQAASKTHKTRLRGGNKRGKDI